LDRQRIDKWLSHARVVRTRSDAARLTEAGHVRCNGKRIGAPSHPVRLGDVVTLALDRSVRVLKIEGFCEKRGGAPAARALYSDLTTSSGAKASQVKACTFGSVLRKVSLPLGSRNSRRA
jgi:ribosome-associated heat shock protein Hsp15